MTNTNEINRNLHRLVFFMDRVAEELLQKHFKLTFSQFRILMAAERRGVLCQADIADFLGLTPAAVSRQIDILTEKKFIASKQNLKNRRENLLTLTKAGKKCAHEAIALLDKAFDSIYAILNKDDREKFSHSLETLIDELHSKGKKYFCNN